jgi:hypothetical protein
MEQQRQESTIALADAALALTSNDSEHAMSIAQRLASIPPATLKAELLALLMALYPASESVANHTHDHEQGSEAESSPVPHAAPAAAAFAHLGEGYFDSPDNGSPLMSCGDPTARQSRRGVEALWSQRERLALEDARNGSATAPGPPWGVTPLAMLHRAMRRDGSCPATRPATILDTSQQPPDATFAHHASPLLRAPPRPTAAAAAAPPPAASPAPPRGSRLDTPLPKDFIISVDDLKLRQRIGSGAAGATYLGSWKGATVAVKVATGGRMGIQGWRAEVAALGQLRHPNVVRCWGVVVGPPMRGVVLEHCGGGDVRHALQAPTPPGFFSRVAEGVATGVAYMHSMGMLHRDLKSSNCLLDAGGGVKVRCLPLPPPCPRFHVCITLFYFRMCTSNHPQIRSVRHPTTHMHTPTPLVPRRSDF